MTAAAIALAAVLIIGLIYLTWWLIEHLPYSGRHDFADPADTADPDGDQFLHALHHEPATLPAPGRLPMLPDDPPPDDTIRIPHAHGTWGMSITELLDQMEATYKEKMPNG